MPRHTEPVTKKTVFGDPLESAFVGFLVDYDNKMVHVYLRCVENNKAALLSAKIDSMVLRNKELTPDELQELGQLLVESKSEESDRVTDNTCIVKPSVSANLLVINAMGSMRTSVYNLLLSNVQALKHFLEVLEPVTNMKSFDNLCERMAELNDRWPKRYRFLREVKEDGSGEYV